MGEVEIPDLSGKVCLVTGANSGIGEATVKALAQHNPAKIYLAARSRPKAEAALERIRASSSVASTAHIEILMLDQESFDSVKAAAHQVDGQVERLDLLFLNGGVSSIPERLSESGYEVQWATNYMGHALLTQLLMPKLLATTRLPNTDVRVVVMSSLAHKWAPGLRLDSVRTDMKQLNGTMGMCNYWYSQLAKTLFAYELAKRYPQVTSSSLHPGTVMSELWYGEKSIPWLVRQLFKPFCWLTGISNDEGAKSQLWCAFSKTIENGAYYEPVGKRDDGKLSRDSELSTTLWDWTEKELAHNVGSAWPAAD